uniref:(northern house mosquito) hypothetical protein n=1 Tax=Culex pipiens TaxID=7175 RepID=A0A8D8CGV3_CULPI
MPRQRSSRRCSPPCPRLHPHPPNNFIRWEHFGRPPPPPAARRPWPERQTWPGWPCSTTASSRARHLVALTSPASFTRPRTIPCRTTCSNWTGAIRATHTLSVPCRISWSMPGDPSRCRCRPHYW